MSEANHKLRSSAGMTKTPEQMAEEYAEDWHKDCDYPEAILKHTKKATETVFLAGYKTAEEKAEKYMEQEEVACDAINHAAEHLVKTAFLAGYQAAKDEYKTKISELEIELENWKHTAIHGDEGL